MRGLRYCIADSVLLFGDGSLWGFWEYFTGAHLATAFFLRLSYMRGRFKRWNRKKIFEVIFCSIILTAGFGIFFLSTGFTIKKVVTEGCGGANATAGMCNYTTH